MKQHTVPVGSITTGMAHPKARSGLLLVGILLIGANLRAGITSVGPVLGDIRTDLDLPSAAASVLISLPLIAFALVSPVAATVAKRLGMERALGASLALLTVAIVARSLPWEPALWIGTALLGVAIAVMNVVLPSLIKRDYPDRVGKVTGLYSSVQSGAAALASGFAVPLAGVTQEGWRLALGIWAGLALIALAVFAPQLRSRAQSRPAASEKPDSPSEQHRSPWSSALAWQVTLFMGMQSTVYYTLITWWPSVEQSHGLSDSAAGSHQFVYQILGIVGNIVTAALIHRSTDQRLIALTCTGLVMVGVVGELMAPTMGLLWVVCTGAGAGSSIVLSLSLFGLRTRHHGQAAALSGMAQSVGYLLAACGPILIGLLHDVTDAWTWPLTILLALLTVQIIVGQFASRDRYLEPASRTAASAS